MRQDLPDLGATIGADKTRKGEGRMIKTKEQVTFKCEEGVLLAVLRGEIDHHSALSVRRALDEALCRYRPHLLRLDVSSIDFMDSSGLGLLMGRYALIKRMGGEMVLLSPTPAVLRIVRLAGMERMLKIETT